MPSVLTNVDLVCLGVEYMAVTRAFNGLELLGPTPDEIREMEILLGRAIDSSNFKSGDRVKRPSNRREKLCLALSPRSPSSLAALS